MTVRHRCVDRLIVCVFLSEDCFNPCFSRSLSLSLENFAYFFLTLFSVSSVTIFVLVRCFCDLSCDGRTLFSFFAQEKKLNCYRYHILVELCSAPRTSVKIFKPISMTTPSIPQPLQAYSQSPIGTELQHALHGVAANTCENELRLTVLEKSERTPSTSDNVTAKVPVFGEKNGASTSLRSWSRCARR